jgi:hypothetical protein
MKTAEDIQADINKKVEEARKAKKKINVKKYQELQKIARVMTHEEVNLERSKLTRQLKQLDDIFPRFLADFTLFRHKNEEKHLIEVKKAFSKEFDIPKIKRRIKDLDYLLNIK